MSASDSLGLSDPARGGFGSLEGVGGPLGLDGPGGAVQASGSRLGLRAIGAPLGEVQRIPAKAQASRHNGEQRQADDGGDRDAQGRHPFAEPSEFQAIQLQTIGTYRQAQPRAKPVAITTRQMTPA